MSRAPQETDDTDDTDDTATSAIETPTASPKSAGNSGTDVNGLYCEVSVLVSKAPSVLTYAIPLPLLERVKSGLRVVVPLSGRRVTGLVLQRVVEPPKGVKAVLLAEVLDVDPVVTAEQLALVRFVARYYDAPLQDALRLVLPPDTLTAPRRRFKLTERGERARVFFKSEGLTPADVALLQAFDPGVVVEANRLRHHGGTKPRLTRLIERDLVVELKAAAPITKVRTIEHLVPLDGGEDIPKAAHAVAACDAWIRAFVGEEDRPPTVAEADVALGRVREKVRKLESLGRLRIEERTRAQTRAHRVSGKGAVANLTDAQRDAVDAVNAALERGTSSAFLLEGVTGSGKTEVYLQAVRRCLALGKSALLLVPEIALTPQLVARVEASFQEGIVVLHSALSEAERRDGLQLAREGKARVVVGARSAIFAPFSTVHPLGLIVVDEEHEASLKQDDLSPRYHARDVALWRAQHSGAVAILGSATPSLESRHNVRTGKLTSLLLPARVGGGGELPDVVVVDLKQRRDVKSQRRKDRAVADDHGGTVLTGPLVEAMAETLAANEQVLLFLNRRGWSSTITCDQCGEIRNCPQCAVALTLHRGPNTRPHLRCHQCGFAEPFAEIAGAPPPCPACGQDGLVQLGTGTERVEAEVKARFPDARLARLDRDAAKDHGAVVETINAIQRGDVDIVIGTQMIAKGHDWPAVRLVGIVLADVALSLPDFRAAERAMSLLTQVAGRAGRGGSRGRVIVQTYDPTHAAIAHLVTHDVQGFSALELAQREQLQYPPFSRLARLRVEHPDEKVCFDLANDARATLERAGAHLSTWWRVSGPAPCPIEKLQGRVRVQLVLFTKDPSSRQRLLTALRADDHFANSLQRANARFVVDVDPINML